jgi:hypothetical protein
MFILPPEEGGFEAGYELLASRLFDCIDVACRREEDWPLRVRAAVEAVLDLLAAEPAGARMLVTEPYLLGPAIRHRHEATLERLARLLREGRELGAATEMAGVLEQGLVGAAAYITGRALRSGDPLPDLAPDLTTLILTPYVGREEAERIASRRS